MYFLFCRNPIHATWITLPETMEELKARYIILSQDDFLKKDIQEDVKNKTDVYFSVLHNLIQVSATRLNQNRFY